MDIDQEKNPKEQEIITRRAEVERLHIWGSSVSEIATKLGVDSRTIDRDIQANRKGRLKMLTDGDANETKNWLRNELADYLVFMKEARIAFCEQARSFTNEAAKSRALWYAVQIENQKVETVKSLMFSFDDLRTGGCDLDENADPYED